MRAFLRKHRQMIAYLFWGGATTAVNFICYFLLTRGFSADPVSANIAAWAVSVIFAFFVNRCYVFHGEGNIFREFFLFAGGRVFSGALETGILWLCVDILKFHDGIVKIAVAVLVVILNYIFSKLIFRKKD